MDDVLVFLNVNDKLNRQFKIERLSCLNWSSYFLRFGRVHFFHFVPHSTDLYDKFFRSKMTPGLALVEDIHVVCGCLKLFLRNLSEPLVTFEQRPVLASVSERVQNDPEGAVEQVTDVLDCLPAPNRDTLSYIVLHLKVSFLIGVLFLLFSPLVIWCFMLHCVIKMNFVESYFAVIMFWITLPTLLSSRVILSMRMNHWFLSRHRILVFKHRLFHCFGIIRVAGG